MEIFLFYRKMFVLCTHLDGLIDAILINTLDIPIFFYLTEDRNNSINLSTSASWSDTMINPQWLELPLSRTSHGPKDVWAIEV